MRRMPLCRDPHPLYKKNGHLPYNSQVLHSTECRISHCSKKRTTKIHDARIDVQSSPGVETQPLYKRLCVSCTNGYVSVKTDGCASLARLHRDPKRRI